MIRDSSMALTIEYSVVTYWHILSLVPPSLRLTIPTAKICQHLLTTSQNDVGDVKGKQVDLKGDNFFKGLIDDDQAVLVGFETVEKIKVPASLPDEEVEKIDANISKEEEDDTHPHTPLLNKRKRALILKSSFVDFSSSDSKTSLLEPFNVYEDSAQKISPSFRLGVDYVEDKTCCLLIHMNTIFYYLRKKEKYSSIIIENFAATDCLFDDSMQSLYQKFCNAKSLKSKMSHIHVAHPIAHYIKGLRIPSSKPWYEVDHVLFIVNLRKESHWVFGRFDLNERIIFLYNSLRTAKMNVAARNAMKAHSNKSTIPDSGFDVKAPLRVVEIASLPGQ
ncbi:hypothetical protein F8388_014721 [Cannabis sativa]|uniref:Ubiquitin-like protease family profile domain-containing protein n=1 Tax=Cannabis sativa TaxID=3483 RepID=A0A7J6GZD8_CANSA|nr:hypothetical protein F8388_014721 [Cannabis sativa]